MKIILGSQSPGRKKVLAKMGYSFEVRSPNIDEKAIRSKNPARLVVKLAHAKATALLKELPRESGLLITSDQVTVCNGTIYEKPISYEEAESFFESYRRYPAETVTGVVVTDLMSQCRVWGVDQAKVWFRSIPKDIVKLYIETGGALEQAGGFDHEHVILSPYVDRVEGEDDSITGLPVELTRRLMNVFLR